MTTSNWTDHQGSDLDTLRGFIYRGLVARLCVPELEVSDPDTNSGGTKIVYQHDKQFFPAGTAKRILHFDKLERLFGFVIIHEPLLSLGIRPSTLAQNIENRGLHEFLAILIYSRCSTQALINFTLRLVASPIWGQAEREYARLPVSHREKLEEKLRTVLGDNEDVSAHAFAQEQDLFFAAVIEEHQEVKHSSRRVPYMKEKLIGEGSFGKIYEVVIAPQHFREAHLNSLYAGEITLARKDYELNAQDKTHEKERDVLRDIIRSAKKHENILENMGTLQIGSTYSLFMPKAACNLQQYMELYPDSPEKKEDKARILRCAAGVAGAIKHLHEDLESPQYEKLICFHMDLKPQNILIFHPQKANECWKLSDFNMSRVKPKLKAADDRFKLQPSYTIGNGIKDIDKIFRQQRQEPNDSSFADPTVNRRGAGTYLAPETAVKDHRILAESDIWSLGCVISVVLTYVSGGFDAVKQFRDLRFKLGHEIDRFFTFPKEKGSPSIKDAVLSNAVKRWFKQLRLDVAKHNTKEGIVFADMTIFLEDKVLLVNPINRRETKVEQVRESLIKAAHAYDSMSTVPDSLQSPKKRGGLLSVFSSSRCRTLLPETKPLDWKIDQAHTIKACAFGPNAQPLVCVTETTIAAYSLEHACRSTDFERNLITYSTVSIEDESLSWNVNVGVSNEYIVATTTSDRFDCYVYKVPGVNCHTDGLELSAHLKLDLPVISRLALSPDGKFVALVLRHPNRRENKALLYLVSLARLSSTDSDCVSHATHSSSSRSSSSTDVPLGKPISLPVPVEDIRDMRFSKTLALYVVTRSRIKIDAQESTITVYTWTMRDDKKVRHKPSVVTHDGGDDLLQALFTAFAPYNDDLAYVMISQEKMLVSDSWTTEESTQGRARGFRLLNVLMGDNDHRVFSFGTKEANNQLRLLSFPLKPFEEDVNITKVAKLANMTHQSKFAATLYSPLPDYKLQPRVWVADINGSTVRIIPICLDSCPI